MKIRIQHIALLVAGASIAYAANDVPVPSSCTPDINSKLAQLIASKPQGPVDNVMVCGTTTRRSRYQPAGQHGSHHVFSVLAAFPDGSKQLVEVVTNDSLDGVITAPAQAQLFAYGQAFFDNTNQFAAGIHDTHCSTHAGADNGWIVIDGVKHPSSCA
ncbi:MAG: hypothetical protein JO061_18330, partial [Acidobacteriaceae bacterium]|nr:hypothetical protein [Acidobacteriaceae bacterium]